MNEMLPALAGDLLGALALFGFEGLRSGQSEPITSATEGHNTLVVMPTGSGKSLCYQLPACMLDGLTIVVSPLIALMKDQVDSLVEKGIPATYINSSISTAEQHARIKAITDGELRLVYVAPERFRSTRFRNAIDRVGVRLLAIDEAHCISEWGHDFRPDYRNLKSVRAELGNPPTIALTATATPEVQRDIVAALDLENPQVFISGFERDNLSFEVAQTRNQQDKLDRMLALIDLHANESVVVYCATRKQTDEVSGFLKKSDVDCVIYHGGLTDAQRRDRQDDWIEGKTPVLVATNAFGMGVDKSDVRAVVHWNMPGSLEAYYQEAGRSGRDGLNANCLLLFSFADKGIHVFFIENSFPSERVTKAVWKYVRTRGPGHHMIRVKSIVAAVKKTGASIHAMGLEQVMRTLEYAGVIESSLKGASFEVGIIDDSLELDIDWSHAEGRRKIASRQLKDVMQYASSSVCRQAHIVRYFGAKPSFGALCGSCDICLGVPDYAQRAMLENLRTIHLRADDPDVVIRKALAGIARVKGRRGASAIAGMLVGSGAKNVKQARLHELSTFGILKHMKRDDITHVLDLCARFGWASRNEHGCLSISPAGAAVMRQEEMPTPECADILTQTFSAKAGASKTRKSIGDMAAGTSGTYGVTLELHCSGLGYKEIAKKRDLTVQTVLRHLQKLALAGEAIDVSSDIDAVLLSKVKKVAVDWSPGDREKPLIEQLQGACTYNSLRLHLIPILAERVR